MLRDEIEALKSQQQSRKRPDGAKAKDHGEYKPATNLTMDESALDEAVSIACHLLADIEAAFPLRAEPHTWKSKARWAMKDKKLVQQLQERLQSVESTLQGIVSMEQL